MANALATAVYQRLAGELAEVPVGVRRRRVAEVAAQLGVSERTVYRQLGRHGWESGRAPRSDRGTSALADEEVHAIARIMARGRNRRGQPNIPTCQAVKLAQRNGVVETELSDAQVRRVLRSRGLDMARMRAPEPSISRVSRHPNQVWQVDISPCTQWYLRDQDGGRLAFHSDGAARFYDGKPQNFPRLRLLRYMVTDHYSGLRYARYYYSAGENAEDVVDFLWNAVAPKGDLARAFPFRGIPRRIAADQGPAFKNGLVTGLLKNLDIKVELHEPGNAKANGAVEQAHNVWQRTFEGGLALNPARDLVELNRWATEHAALAAGEDVHGRHGRPPLAIWAGISREQLVEPPDRETFFALAATRPHIGTLNNRLYLRHKGRTWQIGGGNVYPSQKVEFRLTPFLECGVRVWDEDGRELTALEISFDEAGFPENGKRHVWDDEDAAGAAHPAPAAQAVARRVAAGTDEVVVPGVFDETARRLERQAYLVARGRDWAPPADAIGDEPLLDGLTVRRRVADELGRPLDDEEADWWRARADQGLTESGYADALTAFSAAFSAAPTIADEQVG